MSTAVHCDTLSAAVTATLTFVQALLHSGALPSSVSHAVVLGMKGDACKQLSSMLDACLPASGASYSEVADVLCEVSKVISSSRPKEQV